MSYADDKNMPMGGANAELEKRHYRADGPVDEGFDLYAQNLEGPQRTAEESMEWERRSKLIARKFDHRLLAMMCFPCRVSIFPSSINPSIITARLHCYRADADDFSVNYIDKAALAWAVLFGYVDFLCLSSY